jgi:uncharacterized membrane protein
MAVLPVKKIAIAGVLSAVAVVLGITHLGFIPWFSGASVTIMHVPVIVGALLEGPVVGAVIGLIFGLYSLFQAAMAPTGPIDVAFVNPLVSVLPRLFIGPVSWLLYRALRGNASVASAAREGFAVAAAGVAGSLTNTVLVLSGLGVLGFVPWAVAGTVAAANGLPEAAVAALVVFVVVSAWRRIPAGGGRASLAKEEED